MKHTIVSRGSMALGLSVVLLAATAGVAGATKTLSPVSADFGERQVGTTGAPQEFTLNVRCSEWNPGLPPLIPGLPPLIPPFCAEPDPFIPNISLEPPDDFTQTNDCPALMLGETELGTSCTISVTFAPTSAGPKEASLLTGLLGPTAALSGVGVETATPPAPPTPGPEPPEGGPPSPAEPANLPAKLMIGRAQVRLGASSAQRGGIRRLVVRGSLDPRAAGERVAVRFRAAGRQIRVRPIVQPNGRFAVNRRLRGPQRSARAGQLRLRYQGNETLRAAGERLRAARRAVRLRINRVRLRQNRLVVAGRVLPRARRQARIQVKFNRPNGDPAQLATRVRVNQRGRFRAAPRVPPAVRNLGAWVSITHPGRARLFGQRRGRVVGG